MNNLADDELMLLIAKGHKKAFAVLFDRHNPNFFGYAYSLLLERSQTEDLMQNFWLKIVRLASSYTAKGQFRAWAYTLIRNAAFNLLRAAKKITSLTHEDGGLLDLPELTIDHAEDEILNRSQLKDIENLVEALPHQQRMALMLWAVEGLSYEDIAKELETSVSAVKSLLFRARHTIVKALEKGDR